MRAQQAVGGRVPVPDIIARIKDGYPDLRPAEQSVADAVLSDVQGAVDASNAEIATRAGVSQPTVTRFCRAIGCEGVRDFKLQLARWWWESCIWPPTPPRPRPRMLRCRPTGAPCWPRLMPRFWRWNASWTRPC
jgi:hypothetical protein